MNPPILRHRILSPLLLVAGALLGPDVHADTFTWANITGNWSVPANWNPAGAPPSLNAPDSLVFGGDAGSPYIATNDLAGLFLNRLTLNASANVAGSGHVITGNAFVLGGVNAQILQNGAGPITINAPIQLSAPLVFDGAGSGSVTLNGPVSGAFDITKNGTSTFRFGSLTSGGIDQPSANTWFGNLLIAGGTIRFNNNALAAPTALRSNGVVLSEGAQLITTAGQNDPAFSLRLGTLTGPGGLVESRRSAATTGNYDSADIVITALSNGTYGGQIRNTALGTSVDNGAFIVRGVGTQTLTGASLTGGAQTQGVLDISKDVVVGRGATVVLDGSATLASQLNGSIILNGGSFKLDNSTTNVSEDTVPNPGKKGRLRTASTTDTGLETVGGGLFSLIGNALGTIERLGRLQLGTADSTNTNKPRSGALTINVTHASTTGPTILEFQSYNRTSAAAKPIFSTVDFTATDATGTSLALGAAGNSPRIMFTGLATQTSLLNNTGTVADAGWATIHGRNNSFDFAAYDNVNGVTAVTTAPFPTSGSGSSATNALLTTSANISAGSSSNFNLASLKIAPSAAGQTLTIQSTGNIATTAFLLEGDQDFTIRIIPGATGKIGGATARYFQVDKATLNLNVSLFGSNLPVVKAGQGTLVLGAASPGLTAPLVINAGVVRSTIANLPGGVVSGVDTRGDIRLRGGVLEISGGGVFSRALGTSASTPNVSWSGFDNSTVPPAAIDEDRGSGGFAAIDGDLTINLGGGSAVAWEDAKFVNSGHALIFGSTTANSVVNWTNPLGLNATQATVNYNAREFRVIDNPAAATDLARVSGVISGTVHNDLLKTGSGTLELAAANTYAGATLVDAGAVLVNGSTASSFLTDVRNGGTLGGGNDADSAGVVGAVRIESGGRIAPGDRLGNTSILKTGSLEFLTGSKLTIDIGGFVAGGNGIAGYDQLKVTGSISLNGAQLEGSLLNGFSPSPGSLFFVLVNDSADPVNGIFAQGSTVDYLGQLFDISYTADLTTGSFTGGNDIALRAVPEPAVASLVGIGAALIGLRRRRSSRGR